MALSGRVKIAIGVAGVAGASALALGGATVATADDGRTELQIVSGHTGTGVQNANGYTAPGDDRDCPDKTASPAPAQAADTR